MRLRDRKAAVEFLEAASLVEPHAVPPADEREADVQALRHAHARAEALRRFLGAQSAHP